MKSECWITGHVHAYSFFGGVTRILIPDNLKAGVTKNTKYETILNRNYSDMAEYYDTAVIPARVEHPKDKPNAEGAVKHVSTWIIAALRNRKYFSINELNVAVSNKLQDFNEKPFQQREGSRFQAFMDEERSFLKPLPASPYEQAVWSTATIQSDYLITDGINKYSVPFDLIGEIVDIRVTSRTVEAFYQGTRVASHPRMTRRQKNPVIITEHMPDSHKKYLSYNEDEFLSWAHSIGKATVDVVKHFLSEGKVSEQGYKACASLTKLAGGYGHDRLEDACIRSLAYTSSPNIRNISTILKNGQDRNKDKKPVAISNGSKYGFTRGSSYYGCGTRD